MTCFEIHIICEQGPCQGESCRTGSTRWVRAAPPALACAHQRVLVHAFAVTGCVCTLSLEVFDMKQGASKQHVQVAAGRRGTS